MSDEQQQCRECYEVCYPKLTSLEAERDQLKAEIEIVREVNGNRLKLWMDAAKERDALKSRVGRLEKCLKGIAEKGVGIAPNWIDWEAIGRCSVFEAKAALAGEEGRAG